MSISLLKKYIMWLVGLLPLGGVKLLPPRQPKLQYAMYEGWCMGVQMVKVGVEELDPVQWERQGITTLKKISDEEGK